ncbi:hypothetical protein [uncultured Modestobacter sp.]|uniref:hypothetical protein n=1 Tax=uncultured Modestobacter sp. TaxID=380048 RepID=UPI00261550AE|nr:hypothetical protein [uncultured Modestobacter sp.]
MSQRTTSETCPKCGEAAAVTWSGADAFGSAGPVREDAVGINCPNRCQFTTGELGGHFPKKLNG